MCERDEEVQPAPVAAGAAPHGSGPGQGQCQPPQPHKHDHAAAHQRCRGRPPARAHRAQLRRRGARGGADTATPSPATPSPATPSHYPRLPIGHARPGGHAHRWSTPFVRPRPRRCSRPRSLRVCAREVRAAAGRGSLCTAVLSPAHLSHGCTAGVRPCTSVSGHGAAAAAPGVMWGAGKAATAWTHSPNCSPAERAQWALTGGPYGDTVGSWGAGGPRCQHGSRVRPGVQMRLGAGSSAGRVAPCRCGPAPVRCVTRHPLAGSCRREPGSVSLDGSMATWRGWGAAQLQLCACPRTGAASGRRPSVL